MSIKKLEACKSPLVYVTKLNCVPFGYCLSYIFKVFTTFCNLILHLTENVEIFIQKMEIGVDTEGLSIEPVKARKVVVNCFGRKVDANLGIYKLSGNCELLNILYQAGLGARRSEGHGKFEILL